MSFQRELDRWRTFLFSIAYNSKTSGFLIKKKKNTLNSTDFLYLSTYHVCTCESYFRACR